MASSRRDAPLPRFRIRNLQGPCVTAPFAQPTQSLDDADTIVSNLSRKDYEGVLIRNPSAALTYLDDDDGDYITVGSAFELEQRLREPLSRYEASSVPRLHVFMLQHPSPEVRSIWKGFISRPASALLKQPAIAPSNKNHSSTAPSDTQRPLLELYEAELAKLMGRETSGSQKSSKPPAVAALEDASLGKSPAHHSASSTTGEASGAPTLAELKQSLARLEAFMEKGKGAATQAVGPKNELLEAVNDGQARCSAFADASNISNVTSRVSTADLDKPTVALDDSCAFKGTEQHIQPGVSAEMTDPPEQEIPDTARSSGHASSVDSPAAFLASSLKNITNCFNNFLEAQPELRQRIEQTHSDLPAPMQEALRLSRLVMDHLSGQATAPREPQSEASRSTPHSATPANEQRTKSSSRQFEAEKILARRYICYDTVNSGAKYRQYLVRWAGCGPEDDVWYDEENLLSSCQPLVQAFERENPELASGQKSFEEDHVSAYDSASTHCRTAGDRMITFKRYVNSDSGSTSEPASQDISSIDGRAGSQLVYRPRAAGASANKANRVSFADEVERSSSGPSTMTDTGLARVSDPFQFDPADVMAKYPPVSGIAQSPTPAATQSRTEEWAASLRRTKTGCLRDVTGRQQRLGELKRSASLAFDPRAHRSSSAAFAGPSTQHLREDGLSSRNHLANSKISSCLEQLVSMGVRRGEAEPIATICNGDLTKALNYLEEDRKAWDRRSGLYSQPSGTMPGSWHHDSRH